MPDLTSTESGIIDVKGKIADKWKVLTTTRFSVVEHEVVTLRPELHKYRGCSHLPLASRKLAVRECMSTI